MTNSAFKLYIEEIKKSVLQTKINATKIKEAKPETQYGGTPVGVGSGGGGVIFKTTAAATAAEPIMTKIVTTLMMI